LKISNNEEKSIFILFSIEDRLNRIRTGNDARNYLSDRKSIAFLNDINHHLKSKDYDQAILDLVKSIHERIIIEQQFLHDVKCFLYNLTWKIPLGLVILIILVIFFKSFEKDINKFLNSCDPNLIRFLTKIFKYYTKSPNSYNSFYGGATSKW
jgi:uncharacterized membrane protein YgcG